MSNNPTTRNTLEQGRAQHAFKASESSKDLDRYASYAKKLPMMIKTNGLGAALAFAFSKKEAAWKTLYDDVENWLRKDPKRLISIEDYRGSLLKTLVNVEDSRTYRALTTEVLAYLSWLRRFSEGFNQK
jgi:CRISPR-associated protein Cmr5